MPLDQEAGQGGCFDPPGDHSGVTLRKNFRPRMPGAGAIPSRRVMLIELTDPPQHPFSQPPQAEKPRLARVQPPMVYVYEKQRWEYKVIFQSAVSEEELNALGAEGWELVGLVALPETTQFYFKRVRT
jgi:hypothetical protein